MSPSFFFVFFCKNLSIWELFDSSSSNERDIFFFFFNYWLCESINWQYLTMLTLGNSFIRTFPYSVFRIWDMGQILRGKFDVCLRDHLRNKNKRLGSIDLRQAWLKSNARHRFVDLCRQLLFVRTDAPSRSRSGIDNAALGWFHVDAL